MKEKKFTLVICSNDVKKKTVITNDVYVILVAKVEGRARLRPWPAFRAVCGKW